MQVDVTRHIGAISRVVEDRLHGGRPARAVIASRGYPTTIDDLWEAITSAERLPRWFLPITGDLRLGGRYQLQGNAGGTITACEPPRRFEVTWEHGGETTWLTVRLAEVSNGETRLELEHVAILEDLSKYGQFGPGAVGIGWDLTLMGLAEHLASGGAVDPAQGMAWMVSAPGKSFMRLSSDDWCRAAIAGGAEPEAARAAAARCTAAYTGEGDAAPAETTAG